MQGLHKPEGQMTIKFEPAPNVNAMKLEWSFDGSILYINISKGKTISAGQHLGVSRGKPLEQSAQVHDDFYPIFVHLA